MARRHLEKSPAGTFRPAVALLPVTPLGVIHSVEKESGLYGVELSANELQLHQNLVVQALTFGSRLLKPPQ